MVGDQHRRCRELLGPYVLGHLGPDEVGEVEAHLATCADCAGDAAELAPLAGALPARGSEPSRGPSMDELEEQVVVLARRRRRRPRLVASAAALVLILGIAVGVSQLGPTPTQGLGVREEVASVDSVQGLEVSDAAVMPHTWGTEVFLTVEGLDEDAEYELVLVASDGAEIAAGTLLGDAARPVRCIMNGARLREDVVSFELRRSDDQVAVIVSELAPYTPEEV